MNSAKFWRPPKIGSVTLKALDLSLERASISARVIPKAGITAETCAEGIEKAAFASSPKPRYRVGADSKMDCFFFQFSTCDLDGFHHGSKPEKQAVINSIRELTSGSGDDKDVVKIINVIIRRQCRMAY